MTTAYQAGDVVLVEFSFASGGGIKQRPTLVPIDIGDFDPHWRWGRCVVAARITSQDARDRFDVQLVDWLTRRWRQ